MESHRIRNLIPPIYAALILAGFFISATAGVIVIIVGGALGGVRWSTLVAPEAQSQAPDGAAIALPAMPGAPGVADVIAAASGHSAR